MPNRFARRSLYLAEETTYAQATRPADSAYTAMPASNTLEASGGPESLATGRFTGRTGQTALVAGQTSAEGSLGLELLGLAAQAGDGVSPSAEDHIDLVMRGVANSTAITRDGQAVSGLTGTPAVALDLGTGNDLYDVEDLIALQDANGQIRWAAISADGTDGTYTLDYEPQVDGAAMTPTVALGIRQWEDDDGQDNSVTYSGIYNLDGFYREMPGLKVSSLSMEFTPANFATMSVGFQASDFEVMGVDPTFSVATNGDPGAIASTARITGCVYVDGSRLSSASVSVDFGITVQPRPDTCSASGRSDMVQMTVDPVITITTPFSNDFDSLNASKALRDIKVVSGTSGGSVCLWVPNAQVTETSPTDTSGILDSSVTFTAVTVGTAKRWVLARV